MRYPVEDIFGSPTRSKAGHAIEQVPQPKPLVVAEQGQPVELAGISALDAVAEPGAPDITDHVAALKSLAVTVLGP